MYIFLLGVAPRGTLELAPRGSGGTYLRDYIPHESPGVCFYVKMLKFPDPGIIRVNNAPQICGVLAYGPQFE